MGLIGEEEREDQKAIAGAIGSYFKFSARSPNAHSPARSTTRSGAEKSKLGGDHRRETLAAHELERTKVADPMGRDGATAEKQLRALSKKHSDAMSNLTARHRRELEDVAKRHPID
jgi:hypothetical protein